MKKVIVVKNNSGGRIDKFLKKEVFLNSEITRGEIIRNIKMGNVLVNNKIVKPSYILKNSDELGIRNYELWNLKQKQLAPNKNVEFEIILEDKNIIVINKPAGLLVHPSDKSEQDTLVNGLLYKFPEIKNVGDPSTSSGQVNLRPGIVHRLDKDTSGIMIVARNQKTFEELKNKFKNRQIQKTYWAIVCGKLKNKKGIIDKSIARSADYKKQVIASGKTKTKIRPATTEYKVLKEFAEYSLVEAKPKTGRMHQIRVHLSSIGNPILGDEKYKLKNTKSEKNISRHLLHAKKIEFSLNGNDFKFESELPSDFQKFLDEKGIKS
ncbi:MAG TPA: RluA family pseudouridine synthase [Candidatus Moranbacteria bacterium]|nr:RluA family pseudouridine synthase [Candidatus Moranbacteria bacterium]